METNNKASETNNAHEDISHDVPDLSAWLSSYAATPEYLAAEKLLATIASVDLGGFWGSALAFFLATWRSRAERGSLLVITPNQDEADQLFDELEVFSDERVLFFPPWESLFLPDSEPEGDIYSRRLDVLDQLASRPDERCIVVAPIQAVLQPVPFIETLRRSSIELRCGQDLEPAAFAERLIRYGFRNVSLVEGYGEFSMRGDVFDFFPYQGEFPLRVEFFGDTIDSIRRFRPETQRSVAETETDSIDVFLIETADVFRDCFRGGEPLLTDYLGEDGVVCLQEPQSIQERAGKVLRNLLGETHREVFAGFDERLRERRVVQAHGLPVAMGGNALNLQFGSVERFRSTALDETFDNVRQHRLNNGPVLVFCESTGERSRFREIIADQKQNVDIDIHLGGVRRGFEARALSTAVLTTRELFNRNLVRKSRKKTAPTRALDSFIELSSGDYVVHVVHGIARFLGMESFNKSGVKQQFLALEFRGGVKIYVPVSKIDLVQKYIGAGDKVPILDKIGGASWVRKKELVETALLDLASELLQIHAFRKERTGIRYPEDSEWQREFEAAFPFQDTPDQATTIDSIKEDMRSGRPMDRLICGDVGYGKTELSIRAAFKAVENGKQVAILVPTTVLAQQHFRTFSERVAGFPVTVDVLSRFRSRKEQKQVLSATAEGKVDILIGTHRLLSEDVVFRDLGLAIVDEEQRFGVAHKEKFKKLRATVDVLTLTATPIPRTLHMSMLGIRDISSLRTPPQGRTPVRT
ncbi:MAG: DEAD/DEAH box helicase, partial [Planctomycetes bacterium]|nr:DEAD/DEAH box helicase [Planctomycetota bacterium]